MEKARRLPDFRLPRERRNGVSLLEVVVAFLLASMVLGTAFMIMNRTGKTFQRTTDLLEVQGLLDRLVEKIRSDVRSLKSVVTISETEFKFLAGGPEGPTTISYRFEGEQKRIVRREEPSTGTPLEKDFQSQDQIEMAKFSANLTEKNDFGGLEVSLLLKPPGNAPGPSPQLAFTCRFSSKCQALYNPFSKSESSLSEVKK